MSLFLVGFDGDDWPVEADSMQEAIDLFVADCIRESGGEAVEYVPESCLLLTSNRVLRKQEQPS